MNDWTSTKTALWACAAAIGLSALVARGDGLAWNTLPPSLFASADASDAGDPAPQEWKKPLPVSFSLDYTLVSDYVFRGINFSEYRGEGREGPNHQLAVGVEVDLGKAGAIGATFWFECYAFQEQLTPGYDGNIQEIDYTIYYRYEVKPIDTTIEMGWIAYTFPGVGGDGHATYELYVKLSYDDSKLFGTDSPVLSPYVYYGVDYDAGKCGSWLEFGVSHDFAVFEHVTVTPSAALGVDIHYLDKFDVAGNGGETSSARLANILYGLNISYDLSGALNLPPQIGSVTISGFLNYSQAFRDELLNDEFFGGMNVGWSW